MHSCTFRVVGLLPHQSIGCTSLLPHTSHTSCPFHYSFNVHGSVHRNNILIQIQHDATLHKLFYLETALHVSGGTSTHHQESKQMFLQHLIFVTPLLLPAAIEAGSSNGLTNTRCCRYSCLRSR
jgi:hypothetical protein